MIRGAFEHFDNDIEMTASDVLIELEDDCLEQARSLAATIDGESRQWSVYLQALALKGFQRWIGERQPEIAVDISEASVMNSAYASVIDAVCHCKVGSFDVCLLPIWGLQPVDEVSAPRAVVDLPEFAAHFYVVMAIDEAQTIVEIQGFLRYDQMKSACSNIEPDVDWRYPLPAETFNREVNDLLLNLICLEVDGIPLPAIPKSRRASLMQLQPVLEVALPQIQTQPLWKVLSWEQAVPVLTNPGLLKWLERTSNLSEILLTPTWADLWKLLTQPAINTYCWTQRKLDAISEAANWNLALEPATRDSGTFSWSRDSEFSSPGQKLSNLLADIFSGTLPAHNTGRSYRDIEFAAKPVRLYTVAWTVPGTVNTWNLLLIAGAYPGDDPPDGLRLCISDLTGILADEVLAAETGKSYIYAQVEGNFDEKFLVTLTDARGEVNTLPPFEYQPEVRP